MSNLSVHKIWALPVYGHQGEVELCHLQQKIFSQICSGRLKLEDNSKLKWKDKMLWLSLLVVWSFKDYTNRGYSSKVVGKTLNPALLADPLERK